jgi:rhodanese-related sulfurtransferase/predicted transcriptional regulator
MALANPARIALLEVLCQGERGVEALAEAAQVNLKNASAQLKELRLAGLVVARREGRRVVYRVADEEVTGFLAALRKLARHRLPEAEGLIARYFESREGEEPVGREELQARLRAGTVLLVDVRPLEEYSAGHIPGARAVPLAELDAFLDSLPAEREIVAYCRGPYCVLAPQAVGVCRARGLRARRLEDGFPEWRLAGLPVATGLEAAA